MRSAFKLAGVHKLLGWGHAPRAPGERIDPTLPPATRSLRTATLERLKYQLLRLAEGQYTLQRLSDVSRDRLETAWDELTPQDFSELDKWLRSRVGATKQEACVKWAFVRDVFDTVREEHGPADALPERAQPSFAEVPRDASMKSP
jgi:hypothetical protein